MYHMYDNLTCYLLLSIHEDLWVGQNAAHGFSGSKARGIHQRRPPFLFWYEIYMNEKKMKHNLCSGTHLAGDIDVDCRILQ